MTEVIYICSPDYWRHLFLSLRTLYISGTSFDKVKIMLTSKKKPKWKFDDDKVTVERVPNIGDGFWMKNKIHMCKSKAETVIFLDTDTMVVNPIDEVYKNCNKDLMARRAPSTRTKYFYKEKWKKTIKYYGCERYPYLSSGFVIFQNGSHKRLKKTWKEITERILNGEGKDMVTRHANQEAFSISACLEGLDLEEMDDRHHKYAMIGEEPQNPVVYHLGTPNFYYYYLKAEKKFNLKKRESPIKRPNFLRFHRIKNRAYRKIKQKMGLDRKNKFLKE